MGNESARGYRGGPACRDSRCVARRRAEHALRDSAPYRGHDDYGALDQCRAAATCRARRDSVDTGSATAETGSTQADIQAEAHSAAARESRADALAGNLRALACRGRCTRRTRATVAARGGGT